jgi:hypothetical protein
MNENNLFARPIPVGHDLKGICRTGVDAHGTAITTITVHMDNLVMRCSSKHLIIDKKFHDILHV